MRRYIELLNLDLLERFNLQDLKKAYHKMVLKYHPDKAKDEAQRIEFNNKMKKLNEAYDFLEKYLKNHGGEYVNPKSRYNSTTNSRASRASNYSKRAYTQRETYSNSTINKHTQNNNNYNSDNDNGFGEPTLGQDFTKMFLFSIIFNI